MFQGPETDPAKPSSRVLKPPGGGSSNLFGSLEDTTSSSKSHKMSSNIFGAAEGPQNLPKKTNPPGGKESGIFEEPSPLQARQRTNPPGGKTNDIFGSPVPANFVRAHPNKPKDSITLKEEKAPQELKVAENNKLQVEDRVEKKEQPKEPEPKIDNHEPRLGPRPRSHNKVLNPPGGKSSIAFY